METKVKHRPGPWKVDFWRIGKRDQVVNVSGGLDASEKFDSIAGNQFPPERFMIAELGERNPKTEANARLIAAAPDLLEACKKLVEGHATLHPNKLKFADCDFCNLGKQAIAKAEGQEVK